MTVFFGVIAAAILLWFGLKWFAVTPTTKLLTQGPGMMAMAAGAIALLLAMTGRIGLAVPAAVLAAYLWGRRPARKAPQLSADNRRDPYRSMVRSAAFEMIIDQQTGAISGRILAGTFEGRDLDSLNPASLRHLYLEIQSDSESVALFEAYLDRRLAGWRKDFDFDESARKSGTARAGALSEEEAYQILGLANGAGEAEIRAAHRRLMKRVHPDQGGSTFLAARINQAKDRLLSKHR
ncbi:Dna-J like membrane chaperone protein [Hartmannibacter diazotrophicus]|uniref:Dna-J like membrane chaperone protein n=1 Tax=Hartmannibacter diazotrophicus TaxID=1482074 RepID=A0A2C9D6S8_9HYPH|nr:DnaJ domain-containing protein [Hartmannibacter diazotrophicus]SON56022.1 Dna-J like membrane chaperone protein [Hartmannibacter diazotrophicus]